MEDLVIPKSGTKSCRTAAVYLVEGPRHLCSKVPLKPVECLRTHSVDHRLGGGSASGT